MSGLERQISLWEGPASVSLYLTDNEVLKFVDYVRQSKVLSTRNNIEYHLILARQVLNVLACNNFKINNINEWLS